MIDEIFDRAYQDNRGQMNAGIANAFNGVLRTLGESFKVLHRIEWSAPWQQPTKLRKSH